MVSSQFIKLEFLCFKVMMDEVVEGSFLSSVSLSFVLCEDLGYSIAIITPMRQDRTCGQVGAPSPTPSAPKQWKSDVPVKS